MHAVIQASAPQDRADWVWAEGLHQHPDNQEQRLKALRLLANLGSERMPKSERQSEVTMSATEAASTEET